MTLLVNLLKAIDLKVIDKEKTNLNFVITRTPISNLEYSKLLLEKCKEKGIIVEEDTRYNYLELDKN